MMKRILVVAGLVLGSTAVGLLLAETLLRIIQPDILAEKIVRRADPVLNHGFRPRSTVVMRTSEFAYRISTNSAGFRDREFPSDTSSEHRIAFLGDSYTEGCGVELDSAYVKQVERKLNALSDSRYFCMNFGVSSYSPIIEYLQLVTKVLEYHPDLVILNYNMTDVVDDSVYASVASFSSTGLPIAVEAVYPVGWGNQSRVLRWMKGIAQEHSYLWTFVRVSIANQAGLLTTDAGRFKEVLFRHTIDTSSERWAPRIEDSERYIGLVADTLRVRGIPFLLCVHPHGHQISSREWVKGRKAHGIPDGDFRNSMIFAHLEKFSGLKGIPYLDISNALRSRSDGTLYYSWDGHWTNKGNRIAADTMAAYLLEHPELLKRGPLKSGLETHGLLR
jgi:hypothetical protein